QPVTSSHPVRSFAVVRHSIHVRCDQPISCPHRSCGLKPGSPAVSSCSSASRGQMHKRVLAAAILTIGTAATPAFALDVGKDTTVGGLVFFDVSNISLQNENAKGQKVDTPPNGFGFDVKRFYLIVDHRFNDVWSANLTTDAQYSTAATTTVVTPPSTPGGD